MLSRALQDMVAELEVDMFGDSCGGTAGNKKGK
jgi:hypothetical protein